MVEPRGVADRELWPEPLAPCPEGARHQASPEDRRPTSSDLRWSEPGRVLPKPRGRAVTAPLASTRSNLPPERARAAEVCPLAQLHVAVSPSWQSPSALQKASASQSSQT